MAGRESSSLSSSEFGRDGSRGRNRGRLPLGRELSVLSVLNLLQHLPLRVYSWKEGAYC